MKGVKVKEKLAIDENDNLVGILWTHDEHHSLFSS